MFIFFKKFNFFALFLLLSMPTDVFAYFDPGSASFIIQILVAFIGSVIVFLKNPITFIKEYFKKKHKIDDKIKDKLNK